MAGKPHSVKTNIKTYNVNREAKKTGENRYLLVKAVLAKAKAKSIVIDDTQYLLAFDSFDKAKELTMANLLTWLSALKN